MNRRKFVKGASLAQGNRIWMLAAYCIGWQDGF
jgi:hypothetical protein